MDTPKISEAITTDFGAFLVPPAVARYVKDVRRTQAGRLDQRSARARVFERWAERQRRLQRNAWQNGQPLVVENRVIYDEILWPGCEGAVISYEILSL